MSRGREELRGNFKTTHIINISRCFIRVSELSSATIASRYNKISFVGGGNKKKNKICWTVHLRWLILNADRCENFRRDKIWGKKEGERE